MRAVKDSLAAPLQSEVGDNKKIGMGSVQVPFLLAEQRRGWGLMISVLAQRAVADSPRSG
ncbi:MAG: hypothetical protein EHM80_12915 [Nitrospiraceae bacterium]|nr:MAG: hypothetical protein EHM80_12915 [Nitrospiraceae bacterium]